MIGLFVSSNSISIIKDGSNPAPQFVTHPTGGDGKYELLGTDSVFLDGELQIIAFYEQVLPTRWELAIRKVGGGEEFGSF
jgi:hypothetical protein